MTATEIPASRHAVCEFCKCDVDKGDRNTYHRGAAWFKNRGPGKGGGIHSFALVDWTTRYACQWCIDKISKHIPIGQERLFDLEE